MGATKDGIESILSLVATVVEGNHSKATVAIAFCGRGACEGLHSSLLFTSGRVAEKHCYFIFYIIIILSSCERG